MPEPAAPPRRRGLPATETELYAPVKALLQHHGFAAKGEVRGCDIVAVGPAPAGGGEPPLLVVELKRAVTLAALMQAVDRFAITDLVYLAVPAPPDPAEAGGAGAVGAYTPRLHRLCRRLGLGLIAVEPAAAPEGGIAVPVRREHARRLGDPSRGGMPGGIRLITAYRQAALRCAAALREAGDRPLAVRAVREAAESPEAGRILYRNVYGWFEPVGRDLYRLTEAGLRDLDALGPRAGIGGGGHGLPDAAGP